MTETDVGYRVWCGLDVGKQAHHACALDETGRRLYDRELPQDQRRLEELFTQLQTSGRVLVIVDQPNTIGALPIAVARSMGIEVAYLPGLAMRRIADLHPAAPRPTPETRSSSPTRPAPCPTLCAGSIWARKPWPS